MAGAITPSFQFQGSPNTYTHTQFNDWLGNATLSGINRADFASTTRPVTVSASAPSTPQAGELWYDTNTRNLRVYDNTLTDWVSLGPQPQMILTAQSTIASADVIVFDTGVASSVETTTTANALSVAGIARDAATSGTAVPVQFIGTGTVNCTAAAVAIGDRLVTSTTAGQARTATSAEGNQFAIAISSKDGTGIGTVSCSLVPQARHVPTQASVAFTAYSYTAASLTAATWYDFPSNNAGATPSTAGSSLAIRLEVTPTRSNQPVTFTIIGLDFLSNLATNFIDGYRVLIRDGIGNDTQIFGLVSRGNTFFDGDGDAQYMGGGAYIYKTNSVNFGVSVMAGSVMFTLPSAQSYFIRPQFRAAVTASYTMTKVTDTVLVAVLH